MFCKNCGQEIDDKAVICPHCGVLQKQVDTTDNGGFAWGLLGFVIPLAGFVLFLVWQDSKPKTAKAAGIGSLINMILFILSYVLIIALSAG